MTRHSEVPSSIATRSRWRTLVRIGASSVAGGLGVLLAACAGTASGPDASESGKVIFADYGGTGRDARVAAYDTPFTEETGIDVVHADADAAKLTLFAEQGRADWDMIDLDPWDIVRFADQGYLAELPSDAPLSDTVPEEYRNYVTGGYNTAIVLAYAPDQVTPTSWADFFDTEKFPGKRALPSFPLLEVLAALLADGVDCDSMYPLNLDRAFAKLDEIRDDVIVYDSFAQAQQYLLQGSASMEVQANGRVQALKEEGESVDYLWNEALRIPWVGTPVIADAPNKDAAFKLAEFMQTPEAQAEFASRTFYGPMNEDALDLLDPDTLSKLPNAPENAAVSCEIDPVAIADQWDDYAERYSTWLAGL